MDIMLNFINRTHDINNSEYVIFQKNVATSDPVAVAWKVIKNCGQGDHHPFTFPMTMSIGASDSDGNYMPQIPAEYGCLYSVVLTHSGHQLGKTGSGSSPEEVQVRNDLSQGAINANCYKDGKLLATRTGIAPQQKAVFEFKPTIWIGAVSKVEEGEVMSAAMISEVDTEISLLGVRSADIVATGGAPISFTLEKVVKV